MSVWKKLFVVALSVSFISSTFLPAFATPARADSLPGDVAKLLAASALPHVPTGDTAGDLLESTLKILMKSVAQAVIAKIVSSTITWANQGFDGNPAYVVDPRKTLGETADSVAISVIRNSAFFCSPEQSSYLQTSLTNYYDDEYHGGTIQNQCNFVGDATSSTDSLTDFYSNFNNGGWASWFSLTQDPNNNPYDAYVAGTEKIDNQVANAVTAQQQDIQTNDGFLSTRPCLAYNPDQDTLNTIYSNGIPDYVDISSANTDPASIAQIQQEGLTLYDESKTAGACIAYGTVVTPGKQIENALDQTEFSGFNQLVNAKDIDDLVSAVMGGLIQRYVTGPKGLFSKDYANGLPSGSDESTDNNPASLITCSANPTTATVGDKVSWQVQNFGFGLATTTTTYSWSGDDVPGDNAVGLADTSSTSTGVSLAYATGGTKAATVSVTAFNDQTNVPTTITAPCSTVLISQYHPLNVSCSAVGVTHVGYNTPVTWKAVITGGSGKYAELQWDGSQEHVPGSSNDNSRMYPQNDTISPKILWPYSGSGGSNSGTTEQDNTTTAAGTTSTLIRQYLRDSAPIPSVNTTITVIDADQTVQSIVQQSCGSVAIDNSASQ